MFLGSTCRAVPDAARRHVDFAATTSAAVVTAASVVIAAAAATAVIAAATAATVMAAAAAASNHGSRHRSLECARRDDPERHLGCGRGGD